ncbi:hypothetical protein K9L97_00655 [Candidatus Woesearchaeota archaeon]|nr:hypothetical protein [Candidatus Woesearchaeota archaeon]
MDEYELLPHEEIQKLRNELDDIKKNNSILGQDQKILINSMERLNASITTLTKIFEHAQEELTTDTDEINILKKENQQLKEQLEQTTTNQNTQNPYLENQTHPQQTPDQEMQDPYYDQFQYNDENNSKIDLTQQDKYNQNPYGQEPYPNNQIRPPNNNTQNSEPYDNYNLPKPNFQQTPLEQKNPNFSQINKPQPEKKHKKILGLF